MWTDNRRHWAVRLFTHPSQTTANRSIWANFLLAGVNNRTENRDERRSDRTRGKCSMSSSMASFLTLAESGEGRGRGGDRRGGRGRGRGGRGGAPRDDRHSHTGIGFVFHSSRICSISTDLRSANTTSKLRMVGAPRTVTPSGPMRRLARPSQMQKLRTMLASHPIPMAQIQHSAMDQTMPEPTTQRQLKKKTRLSLTISTLPSRPRSAWLLVVKA